MECLLVPIAIDTEFNRITNRQINSNADVLDNFKQRILNLLCKSINFFLKLRQM